MVHSRLYQIILETKLNIFVGSNTLSFEWSKFPLTGKPAIFLIKMSELISKSP